MNCGSILLLVAGSLLASGCGAPSGSTSESPASATPSSAAKKMTAVAPRLLEAAQDRLDIYATFALTADLSSLSANQKKMLPLLIDASKVMDDLFWRQAYGDKQALLSSIADPATRRFAEINYGP